MNGILDRVYRIFKVKYWKYKHNRDAEYINYNNEMLKILVMAHPNAFYELFKLCNHSDYGLSRYSEQILEDYGFVSNGMVSDLTRGLILSYLDEKDFSKS